MTTRRSSAAALSSLERRLALGGVVGPVAFTAAWLTGAARRPDYRPTTEPISRLAATGSPDRWIMTAGFAAFGTAVPLYAVTLRRAVPGAAWWAATATGVATLGVAALPLAVSPRIDAWHARAAGAGYASLAAAPLLAAGPLLRSGRRRAGAGSVVAGGASAVALAASAVAPWTGGLQRAGLAAGHAWIAASAAWILAGGPARSSAAGVSAGAVIGGGRQRRGG